MDSTMMYITEAEQHHTSSSNSNNGLLCSHQHQMIHHSTPTKYASASSIPDLIDPTIDPIANSPPTGSSSFELTSSIESDANLKVLTKSNNNNNNSSGSSNNNESRSKNRRHSVLDDLKASFLQKTRRSSVVSQQQVTDDKEKRRNSQQVQRRGSVFYVSAESFLTDESISSGNNVSKDTTNEDFSIKDDSENKDDETTPLEVIKSKGRRKSWHPLAGGANKLPKSERKRRKGGAASANTSESSDIGSAEEGFFQARQKRPSWWNIFVPDSVGR